MIDKWPVVIISNYRTGSSELALQLADQHNAVALIEPVHRTEVLEKLEEMYSSGDMKFVVKYHIDQIDMLDIQKELLQIDSFKIKITRQDKLAQIVSYYIASVRNVWKQHVENIESYSVPVDISKIDQCIETILKNDAELTNSNIMFDCQFQYETLFGEISENKQHNFKTSQPINLRTIQLIVERRIANKLNKNSNVYSLIDVKV
jgi:hypothetical protein